MTSGAKSRRYHHGNLVSALVAATQDIVRERGLEGISLREAARRAGVSPAAPFKHFKSRADLMVAIAEDAADSLETALDAARLLDPDAAPLDQIRALGEAYLIWAVSHPVQLRILSGPAAGLPQFSNARRRIAAMFRSWTARFGDAAATGALRGDADPELAALATGAQLYGLARTFVDEPLLTSALATDPLPTMRRAFSLHLSNLRA